MSNNPDPSISELETRLYVQENQALTAIAEAFAVMEAYEQWEADLIMSSEAWAPNGMAETPRIPPHLWERFLEIQKMRNAALGSARRVGSC